MADQSFSQNIIQPLKAEQEKTRKQMEHLNATVGGINTDLGTVVESLQNLETVMGKSFKAMVISLKHEQQKSVKESRKDQDTLRYNYHALKDSKLNLKLATITLNESKEHTKLLISILQGIKMGLGAAGNVAPDSGDQPRGPADDLSSIVKLASVSELGKTVDALVKLANIPIKKLFSISVKLRLILPVLKQLSEIRAISVEAVVGLMSLVGALIPITKSADKIKISKLAKIALALSLVAHVMKQVSNIEPLKVASAIATLVEAFGKNLLNLAIGLLAVGKVLELLDPNVFAGKIPAIFSEFAQITIKDMIRIALLSKAIDANAIMRLSKSLVILSGALYVISTIPAATIERAITLLAKSFDTLDFMQSKLSNILESLGASGKSKLRKAKGLFVKGGAFIMLAGGIISLAYAFTELVRIGPTKILKGMFIAGMIVAGILIPFRYLEKSKVFAGVVKGALALGLMAAALLLFGKAMQTFASIDWKTIGVAAASVVGIGLVVAGLGFALGNIAAGALALGLMAIGIYAFGKSLESARPGLITLTQFIYSLSKIGLARMLEVATGILAIGAALAAISAGAVAMGFLETAGNLFKGAADWLLGNEKSKSGSGDKLLDTLRALVELAKRSKPLFVVARAIAAIGAALQKLGGANIGKEAWRQLNEAAALLGRGRAGRLRRGMMEEAEMDAAVRQFQRDKGRGVGGLGINNISNVQNRPTNIITDLNARNTDSSVQAFNAYRYGF